MLHVIAYDIVSERRRRKVREFLGNHGLREQKSVVECDLDRAGLALVLEALKGLIRPGQGDRLAVYPLCKECEAKVERWGELASANLRSL
jgi:CRISPR-associated protein Cas2